MQRIDSGAGVFRGLNLKVSVFNDLFSYSKTRNSFLIFILFYFAFWFLVELFSDYVAAQKRRSWSACLAAKKIGTKYFSCIILLYRCLFLYTKVLITIQLVLGK